MIACLGYGSLVWDPRGLPLAGGWRRDGPELAVEFARQSRDDRLTLVVVEGAGVAASRALWVPLEAGSVAEARAALAGRERCKERWIAAWPGSEADRGAEHWTPGPAAPAWAVVAEWARERQLDGVVWAALPYGLGGRRGQVPSLEEAVAFLEGLSGAALVRAAEYIHGAPAQTRTPWRRRLEAALALRVECYASHRGEQTPRRFVLGDRRIEVVEVVDAWLEPGGRYFRVTGDDGFSYLLRHEDGGGGWRLAGEL